MKHEVLRCLLNNYASSSNINYLKDFKVSNTCKYFCNCKLDSACDNPNTYLHIQGKENLKHHIGRGNKCIGHIYSSIIKPSYIYEEEGNVYSFP